MSNVARAYARAGDFFIQAIFSKNETDFAALSIMCKSSAIALLLKFFIVIAYPNARNCADLRAIGVGLRGHLCTELFDNVAAETQRV